jgi:hypothetical protein
MLTTIKCKTCGKGNQLLRDYLKYFLEYKEMTGGKATLVCECGTPIPLPKNINKLNWIEE